MARRGTLLGIGAALAIALVGGALRLVPVFVSDFPLNDGGLFLTMAEDLRANNFRLPLYTTYNDLAIPYAYPPLGFYLTGLITEVTGVSGLDVLRFVPALASVATIPVVYAIGRESFRDEGMALATAGFFAIAPRSYEWLIGGGGIARAPGFLLALVAVWIAIRMHSTPNRWTPIASGTALGAAALCHPEAGIFGAVSVVVTAFFLSDIDRGGALRRVAMVGGTAIVVVLPWLIAVLARHGPEPLLAARIAGGSILDGLLVLASSHTGGGYLAIMGIAASVGVVLCIVRRSWLIPAWMITVVIILPRGGATAATVPAAMAVAFLARDIGQTISDRRRNGHQAIRSRGATIIATAILALGIAGDSLASRLDPLSPLQVLSAHQREGMHWASVETPTDASFVVLSGMPWHVDAEAEWFPVLGERRSLATVQGHEWFPGDGFRQQHLRADALLRCAAASDRKCLAEWLQVTGGADYLFLTRSPALDSIGRECCLQIASLMNGAAIVYRNPDVIIVELEREHR